jgi:hypothetical protein
LPEQQGAFLEESRKATDLQLPLHLQITPLASMTSG